MEERRRRRRYARRSDSRWGPLLGARGTGPILFQSLTPGLQGSFRLVIQFLVSKRVKDLPRACLLVDMGDRSKMIVNDRGCKPNYTTSRLV